MTASIRRARPGDAGTIAAFNVALAKETEEVDLDPAVIGPVYCIHSCSAK